MCLIDGMNHLSAADVNSHMEDTSAAGIEDQISGFHTAKRYLITIICLLSGGSGKSDSEMGHDLLGKA